MRLDQYLVEHGFFKSRSRARDSVLRGCVIIDGQKAAKPGTPVSTALRKSSVVIDDPAQHYVSRAALKLVAGLDHFKFEVVGKNGLDIGSSTGGFCQVLKQRGAHHVVGIDVGHGQIHPKIANDRNITIIEGLNARELRVEHLGVHLPQIITSDVSFISLRKALPPALELAPNGCQCILLVKPQFEAEPEDIGKGGLLRDPSQGKKIAQDLFNWLNGCEGWCAIDVIDSPITGSDGNHEFLLAGEKTI